MTTHLAYLYLLSPLHTGGTSQEGNVVGIAREAHTDLPYLPSSSIRGRLRSATPETQRSQLWGNTIEDVTAGNNENLIQGSLWVGDGAMLWFPIPSLSHGVVWVTSPFLLRRWLRFKNHQNNEAPLQLPPVGSFSGNRNGDLYLKDAIARANELQPWPLEQWQQFIPDGNSETDTISQVFVLSDRDCAVLIQSSLWRQVKVKLDETKTVDGGFRYEEAIPPETVMYFPWGTNTASDRVNTERLADGVNVLKDLYRNRSVWQFGGQESLGRGLSALWNQEEG